MAARPKLTPAHEAPYRGLRAPDIGQDSVEVLLQARFDRGAVDDLIESGAVRQGNGGQA